ncbi:rRNA methylase [Planoprotostelium fungivorum]|uniref:rRNA methylase n=1 Tax=Planoprotostelium fungivorum TaxID=1890364 RepID=A0A2P6NSI5_9EUKA|nr:rRNA methylase [Planoprotostelium fungivorum]
MSREAYKKVIQTLGPTMKESRLQRFHTLLDSRIKKTTIVLENTYDMRNTSACLRNLDSYGIQNVHLVEQANSARIDQAEGFSIWSTDLSPSSLMIDSPSFPRIRHDANDAADSPHPLVDKLALAFGNEHQGITPFLREQSDGLFLLPMVGMSQSFNLSVSVGITLTYLRVFGCLRPDLKEEDREELLFKWILSEMCNPHKTAKGLGVDHLF